MTANVFKEDECSAKEAGMQAHIAKPIDVDVMMKKLADVLRAYRPPLRGATGAPVHRSEKSACRCYLRHQIETQEDFVCVSLYPGFGAGVGGTALAAAFYRLPVCKGRRQAGSVIRSNPRKALLSSLPLSIRDIRIPSSTDLCGIPRPHKEQK